MNMENSQFKREFVPNCEIRIAQVRRLFEEFLDILESLESMWKMVLKLGKNLAKIDQIFTKLRMV